jgi:hypothetical protein
VTREGGGAVGMQGRAASRCSVAAVPASAARPWWFACGGWEMWASGSTRQNSGLLAWQVGFTWGIWARMGRCAVWAFDEMFFPELLFTSG